MTQTILYIIIVVLLIILCVSLYYHMQHVKQINKLNYALHLLYADKMVLFNKNNVNENNLINNDNKMQDPDFYDTEVRSNFIVKYGNEPGVLISTYDDVIDQLQSESISVPVPSYRLDI